METITTTITAIDLYTWIDGNTYTETGIYEYDNKTLNLTITKEYIKSKYKTFDLTPSKFISIFNQMIAILDNYTVDKMIIKILDMNNQSNYGSLVIDNIDNIQNILLFKNKIYIWNNNNIYIYITTIQAKTEKLKIEFLKQNVIDGIKNIIHIDTNITIYTVANTNYYLNYDNNSISEMSTIINNTYNVSSFQIKKSNDILYTLKTTDIFEIVGNILYVYEPDTRNLYKRNLTKTITDSDNFKRLIYTLPEPEFSNTSLKLYINKYNYTEELISEFSESSRNHIDIYLHNTSNNKLYAFNNDTICIINVPFPNRIKKIYNGLTLIDTSIDTSIINNYLLLTNILPGDIVYLSNSPMIWNYDTSNIGNDIQITSTEKIKLDGTDKDDYNLIYHFIDKPSVNDNNPGQTKVYLYGDIIAPNL